MSNRMKLIVDSGLRDKNKPLFNIGDIVISNRSDSGKMTITGVYRDQKGFIYELGKISRREENLWLCYSPHDSEIYCGRIPCVEFIEDKTTNPPTAIILCPFCKRPHRHGVGEGHRIAHCQYPFERRLHRGGYKLVVKSKEYANEDIQSNTR